MSSAKEYGLSWLDGCKWWICVDAKGQEALLGKKHHLISLIFEDVTVEMKDWFKSFRFCDMFCL